MTVDLPLPVFAASRLLLQKANKDSSIDREMRKERTGLTRASPPVHQELANEGTQRELGVEGVKREG